MTRAEAVQRVRAVAADPTRIIYSKHSTVRMEQRRIGPADILAVAQEGCAIEEPRPGRKWSIKLQHVTGDRRIKVVFALTGNRLMAVSVMDGPAL